MSSYSHIKKCFDLSDGDVARAVESREETRELLTHLAQVAVPNSGAAKVLLVFARMATTACEWLDGDLRVEIVAQKDGCSLSVVDDLGVGMAERVFPPFVLPVPVDEFLRAVERVPDRIRPLGVVARGKDRITLGATAELRRSSLPPPAVKIADDSFFVSSNLKAPKAPEPTPASAKAPALPIVNAALPLVVKEETVARRSDRPARAAAAPKIPAAPAVPTLARPPLPRPKKDEPPPAPTKTKSAAPKKSVPPKKSMSPKKSSVAPKRSISPLANAEDAKAIDSGWEDE